MSVKIVVDTNMLLQETTEQFLSHYEKPETFIIPEVVIQELDKYKNGYEAKNFHARDWIRFLREIWLKDGESIHTFVYDAKEEALSDDKPDHQILISAKKHGALLTKDFQVELTAYGHNIPLLEHTKQEAFAYPSYKEWAVSEKEYEQLFENGLRYKEEMTWNGYLLVTHDNYPPIECYFDKRTGMVRPIPSRRAWGIEPRTKGNVNRQKMLMHALTNPDIHLVTALGSSGCGKTLLTIASALEQTLRKGMYKKIVIMRPLSEAGEDIGFLPGTKNEKLVPWMASTFDSLDILLEDYEEKDFMLSSREKAFKMIEAGTLELEALTYIRGRSIAGAFIIVDDSQNMSRKDASTIITRVGEGSKIVFLGDLHPKQIDNPRISPNNSGLKHVIDSMGNHPITAHVHFSESGDILRSPLAQLGVERL